MRHSMSLAVLFGTIMAVATPVAQPGGIYLISSELVNATDVHRAIEARSNEEKTCFGSGAFMDNSYLKSAIMQWCADNNGKNVPMGRSLNAQYGGVPLSDGSPGLVSAHYTNDKVEQGWVIWESDCEYYMNKVVDGCQGKTKTDSRGGYVVDEGYGSVWVDPNAA